MNTVPVKGGDVDEPQVMETEQFKEMELAKQAPENHYDQGGNNVLNPHTQLAQPKSAFTLHESKDLHSLCLNCLHYILQYESENGMDRDTSKLPGAFDADVRREWTLLQKHI